MSVPKLERLMNLVAALLHTSHPISADELRTRVEGYDGAGEAFRRQFERDKDDLREMGVPIRVETVPNADPPVDGYRILPSEYYLPDAGLDADEAAALRLATRIVAIDDPGLSVGLWKLGGNDAPPSGNDPTPLAVLPTDENLGVLFEAASVSRLVGFEYRGDERTLLPRALGMQAGHWYVSGHDLDRDENRVFRLDRIEGSVRRLGLPEVAIPPSPSGFDLLRPWRIGDASEVATRLLVDAVAAASVIEEVGEDRVVAERPDGSIEIELPVTNPEGFRSWVIGLGETVEVLSPPVARAAIVDWLARIAGAEG